MYRGKFLLNWYGCQVILEGGFWLDRECSPNKIQEFMEKTMSMCKRIIILHFANIYLYMILHLGPSSSMRYMFITTPTLNTKCSQKNYRCLCILLSTISKRSLGSNNGTSWVFLRKSKSSQSKVPRSPNLIKGYIWDNILASNWYVALLKICFSFIWDNYTIKFRKFKIPFPFIEIRVFKNDVMHPICVCHHVNAHSNMSCPLCPLRYLNVLLTWIKIQTKDFAWNTCHWYTFELWVQWCI